jgi:protein-S-isoprenylcysteine O-methyltransferase Ste14
MPSAAFVGSLIVRTLVGAVFSALLLFLPAGTMAWPQAWVFLGLFCACSVATELWLLRTDPALLAARMQSPFAAGQTPRDRALAIAILVSWFGWFIFMPLDARRFGWSHVALWAQALGGVLIVAAFWGWAAVLRANSFAATTIRLQPERGQTVVASGPYAVVRHPMYAYALLFLIGAPLLLGSLWGLAGLAVFAPLLGARALGEEAMLRTGLTGYADYARKVRFRLLPGIW